VSTSGFTGPSIRNETGAKPAVRHPHILLDKISINQTIYIQIQDKDEGSDLTIIPLVINTHFYAKSRPGHLMKYGRTQDIKIEFGNIGLHFEDCKFINKEY